MDLLLERRVVRDTGTGSGVRGKEAVWMSSSAKDRCASSECGCDVVGECSWGVQTESDVVVRRRRLMRVLAAGW